VAAELRTDENLLKLDVRRFWDNLPCGVKTTEAQPGTREFYEAVEAHRYAEECQIPELAEFAGHGGERVLEIGGGLGTDGRRFAGGGAWYVDADLSATSLALARRGFTVFGLAGRFVNSDAENLPFRDATFDVVYSHGVLHHTPDTPRAIREAHRVLKPGGKAIIMLYARESAAYVVGVPLLGRLRLVRTRRRMGRAVFNRMVRLPPEHRGWIARQVVVNNSTDGLGNPVSRFCSAGEIRAMFAPFRSLTLEKHYFTRHKVPLVGRRLPDGLVRWLGRVAGGYWYVKAVK
jgi:SAM-dependent methyltransferase